ncbi:MAG TPA: 3-oxo-tetronate kinase, partial [Microlunatus sp.]|nr:3-oxo-tetronate kinase [Microlunatus sp.]
MIGAIADDFTGATDLATMLRRSGHRVAVAVAVAGAADPGPDLDALVIAGKTRTAPVPEAVADTRAALDRLRAWGADRLYVKYCSTFDSTDRGNIGPVLDTVADAVGADRVVVVPALPANGRTVYLGHLFVGSDLLEHSSMRQHPLTPMTRSRVADLLRPQTPHPVAEVHLPTVRQGPEAVRSAIEEAAGRYVVIDTVDDDDLATIGAAVAGAPVVSGGSGLALGLPGPGTVADEWAAPPPGRRVVLSGSASAATRGQVAAARAAGRPLHRIDPAAAVREPDAEIGRAIGWFAAQPADSVPVIFAAEQAEDVISDLDGKPVAPAVERVLAGIAGHLVGAGGTTRLLVAGGETSGAVIQALGVALL